MTKFNQNEFNRRMREAQRRAEQELKREVERVNRANKKAVDDYNRKVDAHNKKAIAHNKKAIADQKARVRNQNRRVEEHNRAANTHNKRVVADLNRQLRSGGDGVRYSEQEQRFADRVYQAVALVDPREYDSFLSYARIDGAEVAGELREKLEELGVAVWFDEVAIVPGHSQSLQMDAGLRKARSGIALLTPAYLTGRFWTERELGALLRKATLVPVLHNVTFEDVQQYSGILPDLAAFSTGKDSIAAIAQKIAAAVTVEDAA